MIAIFGRHDDPVVSIARQKLAALGEEVLFVNEKELSGELGLSWSVGERRGSFLHNKRSGKIIPTEKLRSVLNRVRLPLQPDGGLSDADQHFVQNELTAAWTSFLSSLDCLVIGRPIPGEIPGPFFACPDRVEAVREFGFSIPDVLVSSNKRLTRRYYRACGDLAGLGSPSRHFSWRIVHGDRGWRDVEAELAHSPVFLQSIPGSEILVIHTVGRRALASAWRLPRVGGDASLLVPINIPESIQTSCCALALSRGFEFAEFWVVRTDCGHLYCLDVNESPELRSLTRRQRKQIGISVADHLRTPADLCQA